MATPASYAKRLFFAPRFTVLHDSDDEDDDDLDAELDRFLTRQDD